MAMKLSDQETYKLIDAACRQDVSEATCKKLMQHLELVLEKNNQVNLTAITDLDEAFYLHLLDSLLAVSLIEHEPSGMLCDMGSGNGFPGISLSLVTARETALIEATKKKARLIEEIITCLGADKQIRVIAERIETASIELKGDFQIVTARALAQLSVLLELSSPLLAQGGVLVAYKSEIDESELNAAKSISKKLGMELEQIESREIPNRKIARNMVLFRKCEEAKIKLPRKVGYAQKRPL